MSVTRISFVPTIQNGRSTPAPERKTQPGGRWKHIFGAMKISDWFEVPKARRDGVCGVAAIYMKGCYTCYMHPTKKDMYIFQRTK